LPPSSSGAYRAIGTLLAIVGVICFSLRPGFIKLAYAHVTDPITLIALRMLFSLPFFVAAALWIGRQRKRESHSAIAQNAPISRRDAWAVFWLGFTGYYFSSFADFLGLQYVSAGIGRLILFLYPTLVVMLSALLLRKPPRPREIAALVLTYAGMLLVLSNMLEGATRDGDHFALGVGLVFASAIGYAIYLVAGSQVIRRVGPMRFTAYAMTVASAFCIVQFLLLRPFSALDLPLEVYYLAIAIALLSTVLPTFLTAEALKRVGANQVALVGGLGPVTTILFGYLGLDEKMTTLQIVGALLVLAGVMLVTLRPAR
jgi:drug/metabolite transporter (DMT)-like permease